MVVDNFSRTPNLIVLPLSFFSFLSMPIIIYIDDIKICETCVSLALTLQLCGQSVLGVVRKLKMNESINEKREIVSMREKKLLRMKCTTMNEMKFECFRLFFLYKRSSDDYLSIVIVTLRHVQSPAVTSCQSDDNHHSLSYLHNMSSLTCPSMCTYEEKKN